MLIYKVQECEGVILQNPFLPNINEQFRIEKDNVQLQIVNEVKYLRVAFGSKLSFLVHIDLILKCTRNISYSIE